MSFLSDLREDSAAKEYGVGQEENREAMIEAREADVDLSPDAPRARNLLGSYRTPQAIKALLE